MSVECENLDAFLAADLSPDDYERYERHQLACEACREAINQHRWIDSLLSSPERLELEPVTPALTGSVRESIAWRRQKARVIACSLAAAAVLVVAVGWTVLLNRQVLGPAANQIAQSTLDKNEPSPGPSLRGKGTAEAPRAVFVGGPDLLVLPVASRHANVTIVRVYPTYQASLASPDVSDDSDADHFNGG